MDDQAEPGEDGPGSGGAGDEPTDPGGDQAESDRIAVEVERAEWAQAGRVRARHEAEAAQRQAEREVAAARAAEDAAPTRRRGRVVAVAAGCLVVALVGVGIAVARHDSNQTPAWVHQLGLSDPHGPTGSAPSRVGAVTTSSSGVASTSSTLTSPIDPTSAHEPQVDTTGEDFSRIYRQIEVLEDWLLFHPDPTAVAEIYVPGTDPSTQLVTLLTQLAQTHQTLQVTDYRILGVTVVSRPTAGQVVVHYADTYHDRIQRAADGTVVSTDPYDGRARLWSLTLDRGTDSRWRVAATSFLGYGDVVSS